MNDEEIRARYASRLAENEEDRGKQIAGHSEVREIFIDTTMVLNDLMPEGRLKERCFDRLEEAAMWANKAVASPYPVVPAHKEGRQSLEVARLQNSMWGDPLPGETLGQYMERRTNEVVEAGLDQRVLIVNRDFNPEELDQRLEEAIEDVRKQ